MRAHFAKQSRTSAWLVLCLVLAACTVAPAPALQPTSTTTVLPSPVATATGLPTPASTTLLLPTPTASAVPQATFTPTAAASPTAASASVLPDGSAYQWTVVASGLDHPVDVANAADGMGRLFVIEQPGVVRIIQGGQLLPTPFLDIRDRVGSNGSERGLLGIAFHPKFQDSGYFYLDYTDLNGNTNISRFKVGANPDIAEPSSEKILLHIQQPFANHNGGNLIFGPDGYLYIGMGDGGSQGDPNGNGQNLNTLLGKLLRIDVNRGDPYTIPTDNPLAKGGGRPEIYAYGLRNPWRFEFDPKTGDLYIADVGQDKYEEIDFLPAGAHTLTNFGWNIREGFHAYSGAAYTGKIPLTDPVFEYDHSQGCAVVGGYVYRGPSLPAFNGVYLFSDNCSGTVWGLLKTGGKWQGQPLFSTGLSVSSFGVDEAGELYLVNLSGAVLRLEHK